MNDSVLIQTVADCEAAFMKHPKVYLGSVTPTAIMDV